MKKLRILYTGGTIGGKANDDGIIDDDVNSKKFINLLYKKYPALKKDLEEMGVEMSFSIPIKEFSENLNPSHWTQIAKSIFAACNEGVDAIVIAHGTDTIAYTASALSFILSGLKIPVILTGSNYPLEAPITDAAQNMHDALRAALDERLRGVYIVFSGVDGHPSDVHLGCRVRKIKFSENCFASINADKIGVFTRSAFSSKYSIKIINNILLNKVADLNDKREFKLVNNIVDKILFLKIYPGFNTDMLEYYIERKEVKGIILELYGTGTGCVKGKYSLINILEKANSKSCGIPVFATSQQTGRVVMDTYISSCELVSTGITPLKDMITEAAIPKLMWALGQTNIKSDIVSLMLTNLAGEIEHEKY